MTAQRRTTCAALGALALTGAVLLANGTPGGAATQCRSTTLTWTAPDGLIMTSFQNQLVDTGLVVPAGAPGETVTLTASTYTSSDRYPDGASPSRAEVDQAHESWGLRIGGVDAGPLSTDVPDTEAEGAASPWFSGVRSGSFGEGVINPGAVFLRHASLDGFTESPNSVHPGSVSITVSYCAEVDDTTTTGPGTTAPGTTAPGTTAPATTVPDPSTTVPEPTTTLPDPATTAAPPTTAPAPTTSFVDVVPTTIVPVTGPPVPSTAPAAPTSTGAATTTTLLVPAGPSTVPAPTTAVTPAGPTVPRRTLPETGAAIGGVLVLGGALLGLGAVLLGSRRRMDTR